jgi:CoA:oxalate CoA-transferase
VHLLNEEGVPCSPINTIDKLFDHPQLKARNMIVQVQGKAGKPFRTAGNPIKLTGRRDIDSQVPCSAPSLGQHREAILDELMTRHGAYHLPESDHHKNGGQPVEIDSAQIVENGGAQKARPARKSSSTAAKTRGAASDASSSSDASSHSTATSCDAQ